MYVHDFLKCGARDVKWYCAGQNQKIFAQLLHEKICVFRIRLSHSLGFGSGLQKQECLPTFEVATATSTSKISKKKKSFQNMPGKQVVGIFADFRREGMLLLLLYMLIIDIL